MFVMPVSNVRSLTPVGDGMPQPDRIVAALREAIVTGEVLPGTRLAEAQLARQLHASRTPVREALAQLEREGLVTIVARAGAYVRTVTMNDIDEIYEVRAAIEIYATRLVAQRLTDVGSARIREVLAAMRSSVDAGDHATYAKSLDRFYDVLLDLTGNATLRAVHDSLLGPIRRLRRIALSRTGRMDESLHHAERIANAIVANDLRCEEYMREQLATARESVKEVAARFVQA